MIKTLINNIKKILFRINNSEETTRLLSGSIWSILGAFVSKGSMFVAWIIVARVLGKEVYGEFGIIRSTINVFMIFAGFGLGLTATKFVSEHLSKDKEKVGRIIGLSLTFGSFLGLVIAVIFFFLSPWLAQNTLNAPHLTNELRISSFMLLLSSVNGAQTGVLQGYSAFKLIAKVNLYQGLSAFPLFIIGVYLFGLLGVVIALASNLLIFTVLNFFAIRKESLRKGIIIDYKNSREEFNVIISFSLPATLTGLMVGPLKWCADAMLVNQDKGYSYMGIFSAALVFQNILLMFTNTINAPFLNMLTFNGKNISIKMQNVNILYTWILGVFCAIPLMLIPEIGEFIFGKNYSGETFRQVFSVIMLITSIMLFKQGLYRVLVANNLVWIGFFSNLIWGAFLLGSFYFLKRYGALGLALSYLIAYIINTIILFPFYLKRRLIPKGTILSYKALGIWAIVILCFCISFFLIHILIRIVILIIALYFLYKLFKKILN